jgi:hypothetical protein
MTCPVCKGNEILVRNEFGVVKAVLPCYDCIEKDWVKGINCPYMQSSSYPSLKSRIRKSPLIKEKRV